MTPQQIITYVVSLSTSELKALYMRIRWERRRLALIAMHGVPIKAKTDDLIALKVARLSDEQYTAFKAKIRKLRGMVILSPAASKKRRKANYMREYRRWGPRSRRA